MTQEKANIPHAVVQGKNFRLEMVLMPVAGKDIQGEAPRLQRREVPLPPVEQQRDKLRLHQKAAVVQKRDPHHFSFTAVP